MSAPERIWADATGSWFDDVTSFRGVPVPEYILVTAHEAAVAAARVEGMREAAKLLHWMWNADGTVTERRVAEESAAAILKAAEASK